MDIVISISEDTYKRHKWRVDHDTCTELDIAVAKGVPLPKGHGDLIDRDEVEKLEEALCATECGCCTLEGCFYDRAETIIKADRREEE